MIGQTLSILRHGDASAATPGAGDLQRPLSKQGQHDIEQLRQWAARKLLRADWICTSSALRAQSSAEPFARTWQSPKIEVAELYLADMFTLLDCLQQTPADIQHVLLVGHNPGLSDLSNSLDPHATAQAMTTAELVSFNIAVDWLDVQPGCAQRLFSISPKTLSA